MAKLHIILKWFKPIVAIAAVALILFIEVQTRGEKFSAGRYFFLSYTIYYIFTSASLHYLKKICSIEYWNKIFTWKWLLWLHSWTCWDDSSGPPRLTTADGGPPEHRLRRTSWDRKWLGIWAGGLKETLYHTYYRIQPWHARVFGVRLPPLWI